MAVAEPIVEDWLDNLGVYSARRYGTDGQRHWISFDVNQNFVSGNHEYTYFPASTEHTVYLQASASRTVKAVYCGQSYARPFTETLLIQNSVESENADQAVAFLQDSGYSVPMTIQVEQKEDNEVVYYQNYNILFARQLKLY